MILFDPGFRPAYEFYRLLWTGLDWLYPPKCFGCDMIGTRWCESCQDQLNRFSPPHCQQCGIPDSSPGPCNSCQTETPAFDGLRSLAEFDGSLKTAFYRLKYRGDISLGEALSRPLVRYFKELDWNVDIVTPIPTSKERLASRGYNQAALITFPFSLATGIPYRPGALTRLRSTPSQVGLSGQDRRKNLEGAFISDLSAVKGRNVLVIDDVTTTGATIEEASRSLSESGAAKVYCLTVARSMVRRHGKRVDRLS